MWNSRSPCGAKCAAERRSSHWWTNWIALDKENHWKSTPAVAPDGWVQWALHNPSVCCSQLSLDGAAQNGLGIESSQAVTDPTICDAKFCLTSMITWQVLYPRSYSFSLSKVKTSCGVQFHSKAKAVWQLLSHMDMSFEISTIGPQ